MFDQEKYKERVKLFRIACMKISDSDPNRSLKQAFLESYLKKTPAVLSIYYETKDLYELKKSAGYYIEFEKEKLCPVDDKPLEYVDVYLEFATGYLNFPKEILTNAELEECKKLNSAITRGPNLEPLKNPPKIPMPFQCPNGHKLWLNPDGTITQRGESSVVDKTMDFALKIGIPRTLE